jgi:hypothetical protein
MNSQNGDFFEDFVFLKTWQLLHIFSPRKHLYTKDIRKVRKRQHQYPEFGHIHGEIFKKPGKKYISIQGGTVGVGRVETQKTINFNGS